MKANELRIGNYVNIGYDTAILRLSENSCYVNTYKGVFPQMSFMYEALRPIPITEEWLLKFGFKHDKVDTKEFYTLHYFDCKFLYTEGRIKLGIQGVAQYHWLPIIIDYVHELQNAYFTLTGEELPCS